MVRMRFAAQALDELRKLDPETPVTLRFIKQLMRTGAIPSVPMGNGNRRLLNFDALVAYLENPPAEPVRSRLHRVFDALTSGGGANAWRTSLLLSRAGISGIPVFRRVYMSCTDYCTLSRNNGVCYAEIRFLSNRLNRKTETISRDLKVLEDYGLIARNVDNESGKRYIKVIDQTVIGIDHMVNGVDRNGQGGLAHMVKEY